MYKYKHCKVYALAIEVGSAEPEDATEVLELILKLVALVNDHTLRTAYIDDSYTDPIKPGTISV